MTQVWSREPTVDEDAGSCCNGRNLADRRAGRRGGLSCAAQCHRPARPAGRLEHALRPADGGAARHAEAHPAGGRGGRLRAPAVRRGQQARDLRSGSRGGRNPRRPQPVGSRHGARPAAHPPGGATGRRHVAADPRRAGPDALHRTGAAHPIRAAVPQGWSRSPAELGALRGRLGPTADRQHQRHQSAPDRPDPRRGGDPYGIRPRPARHSLHRPAWPAVAGLRPGRCDRPLGG